MSPTPREDHLSEDEVVFRVPAEPHDCPYLEGRVALEEGFYAPLIHAESYQRLLDRNFRRAGRVIYRPACPDCDLCREIRIPIEEFRPSRSQRRCRRRNADLSVQVGWPRQTAEKEALYRRYLEHQHPGGEQPSDPDGLREFLYESCVETIEVEYREPSGRLLAVSILDQQPRSLSGVYHYFEPEARRRGLGTYSILRELELGRELGATYYYLGFWIPGARTMEYKARFLPHEIWSPAGWKRSGPADPDRRG